jgi:hypothetical protein
MTYPIRIHPGSRQSPRSTEPTRLIHPNRRRLIPIDLLKRDGGDPPQPKVHVHAVHRSTKTGLFGQSLHGTLLSMLFLPDDHPPTTSWMIHHESALAPYPIAAPKRLHHSRYFPATTKGLRGSCKILQHSPEDR